MVVSLDGLIHCAGTGGLEGSPSWIWVFCIVIGVVEIRLGGEVRRVRPVFEPLRVAGGQTVKEPGGYSTFDRIEISPGQVLVVGELLIGWGWL